MNLRNLFLLLSAQTACLSASLIGEANDPQLAFDNLGDVSAFWEEIGSTHFSVRSATYVHGEGWQAAQTLSQGTSDAFDPAGAMNGVGDTIVVWRQNTGTYFGIYAATGIVGTGWSDPVLLSSADSTYAWAGLGTDGKGLAIWQQKMGGRNVQMMSSQFVPGPGWTEPTAISAPSQVLMVPTFASTASGKSVSVWQMPSSPGPLFNITVQAAIYNPDTGWEAPVTLSNPNYSSLAGSAGLSAAGEVVFGWASVAEIDGKPTTHSVISAVSVGADGVWGEAQILSADDADALTLDLDVNASGQAVIVWESKSASDTLGMACIRSSDGVWGSSVQIAPSGARLAEVSMNDDGKAVAVWTQPGDDEALIIAAIYDGGTWGAPTVISASGHRAANPEVRLLPDGSATVAWQSDADTGNTILSARLSADNSWSAPVQINS